jgi:hypothetical protein
VALSRLRSRLTLTALRRTRGRRAWLAGLQWLLGQTQDGKQRERRKRRRDDEHGLDRVDDVGARLRTERMHAGTDVRPSARCEYGAESRRPDSRTERAEEARRRGRDAELTPIDTVLDGNDQHLRHHSEAEPVTCDRDARRRPGRIAAEDGESSKPTVISASPATGKRL